MGLQNKRLVQQAVIGVLAFGFGTVLGLLFHRAWRPAFTTGAIAVPVAYVCVLTNAVQQLQRDRRHYQGMRHKIRVLHQQHQKLTQDVQHLERDMEARTIQRDRLIDTIAGLNQHHNELIQALRQYRQQHQGALRYSPSWGLPTTLAKIAKTPPDQTQTLEDRLHSLQTALERIQTEILDQEENRDSLERQLRPLQAQKNQLTTENQQLATQAQELRTNLSVLQQSQIRLKQSLFALQEQHQETAVEVQQQQAQLSQLYVAIADCQQRHQALKDNHEALQTEPQQLATPVPIERPQMTELQALPSSTESASTSQSPPQMQTLSSEWLAFVRSLSGFEKQALNAMILDDEFTLQRLLWREQQSVELCWDALNDKAIATLGDALVEGQEGVLIPYVNEDYATTLAAAIAIPFYELLILCEPSLPNP